MKDLHTSRDTQEKWRGWWLPVALLTRILVILVLARVLGIGERLSDLNCQQAYIAHPLLPPLSPSTIEKPPTIIPCDKRNSTLSSH